MGDGERVRLDDYAPFFSLEGVQGLMPAPLPQNIKHYYENNNENSIFFLCLLYLENNFQKSRGIQHTPG